MEMNKYGMLSIVIGVVLFFGTYFLGYNHPGPAVQSAGLMGVVVTLFYGGLLWLGIFFFLVGLLMLVL